VGCGPARTLLSPDGSVLWVTARQSDELLGFAVARLLSDPHHALIARLMVGEVPLGETFADGGRRIVLVDSNLNNLKTAVANLAVVDTASALAGRRALLGYVPTGLLPRAVAVEPGRSALLVSDQNSGQLQAVRIADLP
jgi:DNA-binding beta-propeller fold protein YncE